MTDLVLVAVVVWCLVAIVFGLLLARVLGGISHGREERARRAGEDDDHFARSA
jgi:hypothetical protein